MNNIRLLAKQLGLLSLCFAMSACDFSTDGDDSTDDGSTTQNTAPTVSVSNAIDADAGDTITLTATTADADGDSLSVTWQQTSGTTVSISNSDSANASFVAPEVDADEQLIFSVSVSDGTNAPVTDSVTVNLSAPMAENSAPTINAGNDQTVNAGATVTLLANVADIDGDTLTTLWQQTSGTTVSLTNTDSTTTTFTAPDIQQNEALVFTVSTDDGVNPAVSDSVTINIVASTTANSAPTISAGNDQTVSAGENVTMAATATDADGDTLTISWTRVGATQNPLANSTTLTPSFNAPDTQSGVAMEFQLSVDDGVNTAVTDNVVINVVAATTTNSAPTVSAGSDQSVDGGATVTLTSTSSDADGDNLTITWSQTSGTTVSLADTSAASTTFVAPDIQQDETLVFMVSIDDGVNAEVTDTISVAITSEDTQSALIQTHLNSFIVNTQSTTSTYINSIEENVQSAALVTETDTDGNSVEYIYVEATGIADYEFVISQEQIDELNARPNAADEFTPGVTVSVAGETIKFGEDMGFKDRASICEETGGEGFWPPGLPCPENVEHQAYFAATPVEVTNEADYCETGIGTIGLMVNGTSIFDWSDDQSYNKEGVWYNLAPVFEEYDVDVCGGHSAEGEYHHHFYSSCLANLLDDDGDEHSPIYGFAADGFPVYGPYEADGVLAVSGWVARDYGASTTEGGCGTTGERTCVLVDQWDISQGVDATVSAGPDLDVEVTSRSGNPIPTVSGVYYEDFYYAGATVTGAQLDDHNGHDTGDGNGYHYHITVELDDDGKMVPSFPYQIGPRFKGEIPDNGVRSCGGVTGGGPGDGGPPSGGPGA